MGKENNNSVYERKVEEIRRKSYIILLNIISKSEIRCYENYNMPKLTMIAIRYVGTDGL